MKISKRILLSLLLLSVCVGAFAQTLDRYEYWMDSDYEARFTGLGAQEDLTLIVDMEAATPGIHFFNFRAINDQGAYGSVARYLVYVPQAAAASSEISWYEYWMDNDYANRVTAASSQTDMSIMVSMDTMASGVHFFNFRAVNDQGAYGSVARYLVYVPEAAAATSEISWYEYWMDNDYANRITTESSQGELSLTVSMDTMASGIHFFNFRAVNDQGAYGAVSRYLVYVPDAVSKDASPIVGYQYNFNNYQQYVQLNEVTEYEMNNLAIPAPGILEMTTITPESPFVILADKDTVTLNRTEDVVFALQFINKANQWSAPEFTTFQTKDSLAHEANLLEVQRTVTFDKFPAGDYRVVRMDIEKTQTYYLRSTQECAMLLYNAKGKLQTKISASNLFQTYSLGLAKGTYYGILYNVASDADNSEETVGLKLMLTNNTVPTPQIAYEKEMVTITCAEDGVDIYYTLDGTSPSLTSKKYTQPFLLNYNAVVKAMAYKEGLGESYVAKLTVDSYKVEKPVIEFTNLKVYLTCATEGSSIYYTMDGSDPSLQGTIYTKPISVTSNCTVKAVGKKDGYHNSEIASYVIDVSTITCSAPTFTLLSDKLTISSKTTGAVIYYTMDGTQPTRESAVYSEPVDLKHNCVVKAFAVKDGEVDSPVSTYTVDWFQVATPSFTSDSVTLTITCATPDAVIYYAVDAVPTRESTRYTAPITMKENRPIKAFAVAEGFNDSEVATYNPTQFACAVPTVKFDGRSIELSTATDGAVIYYTTDGTYPTGESALYSTKVQLKGLCKVNAIAVKEFMNQSDVMTYDLPCYYNGNQVYMSQPGTISQAFGWCGGEPSGQKCTVNGSMGSVDLAFIHKLTKLNHLDLTEAHIDNKSLPDSIFSGMNLITVKLPDGLTKAGKGILSGCQKIGSIEWNAELEVPEDIVGNAALPNLLLYVRSRSFAPSSIGNIIVNDQADSIVLADSRTSDFYCSRTFTAKSVRYTHEFAQKTKEGVCQGWESIVLPFDVQTVSHSVNGEAAPFAAGQEDKMPFWLYSMGQTGFIKAKAIEANTPYIISMPNEDKYSDCYILAGNVTFSAKDASVVCSEEVHSASTDAFRFVPNFANRASQGAYEINVGQTYKKYVEGSVFVKDLRDIRPFEAYLVSGTSAQSVVAIFDDVTDIDQITLSEEGLRVYVQDQKVYIVSDKARKVAIYGMSGRLVRLIDLYEGENIVEGLAPAVYIVQGVKFDVF